MMMMLRKFLKIIGVALLLLSFLGAARILEQLVAIYPLPLGVGILILSVLPSPQRAYLKSARLKGASVKLEVESPEPVSVEVTGPYGNVFRTEGAGEIDVPFDGFGWYTIRIGGKKWKFNIEKPSPQ